MKGFWLCQRQSGGVKCRASNPNRVQKCSRCGKRRPARKRPAHMAALDIGYEEYLALNGGVEACALCGATRKTRKLQRDHCHTRGVPRGLLCARCNRALPAWMTAAWLRSAADYLERAA